jgi:cold shock CspA family protein/uncharacterized protein YbjQ (UPF0145 family)
MQHTIHTPPEQVMQGIVRAYVPDKGYGFIKGDDGKDYFFRKESFTDAAQVDRIADEAVVAFEERATPKGYRADRLSLVSRTLVTTFVLPDEVLISKTDRLHGWELVEIGDWIVHGASQHSPDQAKKDLQQNARRIGANALLGVEYYKSTGAQGNYRFTIHHFRGHVAAVGRRSARGTSTQADLAGLNQRARKAHQQLEGKIRAMRQRRSTVATALFIGALICLVAQIGAFLPSVVLGIAGGITLVVGSTDRWIEYRRAPIAME